MSFRRAIWADDSTVSQCTKCRAEFNFRVYKHHCRKCGLIFCHDCSRSKMIIPKDELVIRPTAGSWADKIPDKIISDEDNYRCPQRVCDPCSFQLRDLQTQLRQQVSRAYQETTVAQSNSYLPTLPAIDFHLATEIGKATNMLKNFRSLQGEEKIPRELLDIAKGVVFLTIFKVGFMFTGRYGTGLVIAKLPDGRWSAPSALMMTGLGWGLQVGAEVTDVLLVLSTEQAVNTFKGKAQISVGAELGVSVGPIGRSIESDVAAGSKGAAHAFSYATSKGLFVGASLEAAGIAARPDVNRAFYGEKVSISSLLSGDIPSPKGAEPLYRAIGEVMGDYYGSDNNGGYNGHGSSSSSSSRAGAGSGGGNGGINTAGYIGRMEAHGETTSPSVPINNQYADRTYPAPMGDSSNNRMSTGGGGGGGNNNGSSTRRASGGANGRSYEEDGASHPQTIFRKSQAEPLMESTTYEL